MAISQATLRQYSARAGMEKSDVLVANAKRLGRQTAFLSHSHHDNVLAKGVQEYLQAMGWLIYIDWEDTAMPPVPDRTTAARIQQKIVELDWFLFLATENSTASRWCPWEIGYADGKKSIDRILIIPTRDDLGRSHGNEYLQLYRRVIDTLEGGVGVFYPKATEGLHIRQLHR
jgi:hypothetical protein